jgi:hypothetical protein
VPHCAASSIRLAAALAVGCALAAAGCSDFGMGRWNRYNPFRSDDWAAEQKFAGQRAVDRIQYLESIAAGTTPATAAVVGQIARDFPNELDPLVRRSMVRALAAAQTPEAAATLKLALKDQNNKVRMSACEALSRRSAAEAVPLLSETIGTDSDIDVRLAAARSLGSFPQDQGAVRGLGLALEDNDPALQYRAMQSLKSVSGKDYGGNVHAWREFAKGGNPTVTPDSSSWAARWWPTLW